MQAAVHRISCELFSSIEYVKPYHKISYTNCSGKSSDSYSHTRQAAASSHNIKCKSVEQRNVHECNPQLMLTMSRGNNKFGQQIYSQSNFQITRVFLCDMFGASNDDYSSTIARHFIDSPRDSAETEMSFWVSATGQQHAGSESTGGWWRLTYVSREHGLWDRNGVGY